MKKLFGIVVLGLLKYHPIDYGRTCARLAHREIKKYITYDDRREEKQIHQIKL